MAERNVLYLSIARKCAARGENARAMITVINALSTNPRYIDSEPAFIELLADIYAPESDRAFDEEINALEAKHPAFGDRFRDALILCNKHDEAAHREVSFEEYCISQMKYAQTATGQGAAQNRYATRTAFDSPATQAPFPAFQAPNPTILQSPDSATLDPYRSYAPPMPATYRAFGIPEPEPYRPYDVSALNLSSSSCRHAAPHSRMASKVEAKLSGDADGNRRFERIDLSRQTYIAAPDYADTAADRIIVDFDDAIKESPKSAFFSASKTKFRSYDEDVAAMRESSAQQKALRKSLHSATPAERIAEKTHELSDTPSVEPFAEKKSPRFFVSPKQILACAALCLICVFALVIYRSAKPEIEKRAIDGISAAYIGAGIASTPIDAHQTATATPPLVDPRWLKSYDEFLATWHANYFDADIVEIPEPTASDPAPRHAAYIDRTIADGNLEAALRHFKSCDASAWRQHAYFKSWSEASIDVAKGNLDSAMTRYRRLLHSPLAPFARTRLAILALETSNPDAQAAFIQSMNEPNDTIPKTKLAQCIQAIFDRGTTDAPQTPHILPPYDAYCATGRIFSALRRGSLLSNASNLDDIKRLENQYDTSNAYALEAIIRAEIFRKNPERAARYFNDIDLAPEHPQRRAIQDAILYEAFALGNWEILHAIGHDFPANAQIFDAMRFIDAKRAQTSYVSTPAQGLFQYAKTPTFAAAQRTDTSKLSAHGLDAIAKIDDIYRDAYHGMLDTALQKVRNADVIKSHPYEALILQSAILSAQGKNADAALILSGDFNDGYRSLPLIIFNNCYRARANLPLSAQGFIVPFVSSADPVVESARCEILWRKNMPQAKSCIADLNRQRIKTNSAWIMAHLKRPSAAPSGSSAAWAAADAAALSFPDFALAYARALVNDAQFRAAAKQYTRAITDSTTYNAQQIIDIIHEYEATFDVNSRRLFAARTLDAAIAKAEISNLHPTILGAMHLAAARLYQPKTANAMVKIHLSKAIEKLGDHPDILREFIRYYDAKDKPETAAKYRTRLQKQLAISN